MIDEEREFIRTYAQMLKDKDLTASYNQQFNKNVTPSYIKKIRQQLGIKKAKGRGANRVL